MLMENARTFILFPVWKDCSVCSDGYTASLGSTSNECSNIIGAALVDIVSMAAVLIICGILFFLVSGVEFDGSWHGGRWFPAARKQRLQSLKILFSGQILTQFASVANVIYPDVYQSFLDGVDLLNFDINWLLSTGCIVNVTFHDRLIMLTTGPIIMLVVLGVTYTASTCIIQRSDEILERVRRRHFSMVFLVTFLVYAPVSSVLFQMFTCEKLDDGKDYLRADYRIECDSPMHEALQVYAGLMIALYTAGIPTLYAVVLYRNREVLMNARAREEDAVARSISNIWELYKPNKIYYELVECVRRVPLTGVVVFIYPNSAGQVKIAFMMGLFFVLVSETLAPYARELDTWVSRMGHTIVCTSMFLALLPKVDMTDERARNQRVYESVLVFAHVCMVLTVAGEGMVVILQSCKSRQQEDPMPRGRRNARV